MDVEALKRAHKRFANYARFRIDSIGREYDDGEQQRFESMSPQRLILEMRDELADAVNYLAFLDIQLSRWAQRLEEIE